MMPPNKSQTGSAIVFILIGVALFGALMFTLTRSGNNSTTLAGKGSTKAQASMLVEYGGSVQTAVQKLLAKGCSENEISFENSAVSGYANATSPSSGDKHCWVFDPAGGNVTFLVPDKNLTPYTWVIPNNVCIRNIGEYGITCWSAGTQYTDLILLLPGISLSVCQQVNRTLNVFNTGIVANGGGENFITMPKFTGVFTSGVLADNTANITSGCFQGDPTNPYYMYYIVLLARGG